MLWLMPKNAISASNQATGSSRLGQPVYTKRGMMSRRLLFSMALTVRLTT